MCAKRRISFVPFFTGIQSQFITLMKLQQWLHATHPMPGLHLQSLITTCRSPTQQELNRRGKWLHAPVFNFAPFSRPRGRSASDRISSFALDPAPFSTIPLPGISKWLTIIDMSHTMRGDIRFPHGSVEKLVRQFLGTLAMVMRDRTVRLSAVRREFST
jgi:hypothetical protein